MHDVPLEIRGRLLDEARERNVSVNEAAVSILAAHYKVKVRPSGIAFAESRDKGSTNLAIKGGAKLHRKIDIERARRGGATLRGIVLERLALYFGIEPPPVGRRPRTRPVKEGENGN